MKRTNTYRDKRKPPPPPYHQNELDDLPPSFSPCVWKNSPHSVASQTPQYLEGLKMISEVNSKITHWAMPKDKVLLKTKSFLRPSTSNNILNKKKRRIDLPKITQKNNYCFKITKKKTKDMVKRGGGLAKLPMCKTQVITHNWPRRGPGKNRSEEHNKKTNSDPPVNDLTKKLKMLKLEKQRRAACS